MLNCIFLDRENTGRIGRLVVVWTLFVLIFILFLCAGCNLKEVQLAGLDNPDHGVPEQARKAFEQGEYESAQSQFSLLAKQGGSEQLIKTGRYGLSCIALVRTEDMDSFLKALEPILYQFPQSDPVHRENSGLLIRALNHGYQLLAEEKKDMIKEMNVLKTQQSNQKKENEKLQKMVKTLKHQISVLESIDQEIQEKRKNQ